MASAVSQEIKGLFKATPTCIEYKCYECA